MKKRIVDKLPGIIVSVLVAILATFLSRFVPQLGAATLALFIGLFFGNTWLRQPFLDSGTRFSEGILLEVAVLFLGASLSFDSIRALGVKGLLFIFLQIAFTVFVVIFLGRKMKFSSSIYLLMASGNAVCGSSAVAATAPVIKANDNDRGTVITVVNLMGTVLMLLLPVLTYFLYGQDPVKSGALIGGVLQSMGQVVASGSMVSPAVLETATLFKLLRIISLVLVIYVIGRLNQRIQASEVTSGTSKTKQKVTIPWYVKGFIILFIINSFGWLPGIVVKSLATFGNWLELTALSAIGLRLNLKELRQQGKKLLVYALTTASLQIVLAVTLIQVFLS